MVAAVVYRIRLHTLSLLFVGWYLSCLERATRVSSERGLLMMHLNSNRAYFDPLPIYLFGQAHFSQHFSV
jgi:hypothetical protein